MNPSAFPFVDEPKLFGNNGQNILIEKQDDEPLMKVVL
jgi:hypothetical protein